MQRQLVVLLAWLASAAALYGQAGSTYNGHGYGWFSVDKPPGAGWEAHTFGGGGEGFLYKGLAAGGDIGYMFPRGAAEYGVGVLNVNGAYHFVDREEPGRIVPFVTAGYTLAFRSATANYFNWGGGATYWFSRRVGLRVELRDFRPRERLLATSIRFGIQFSIEELD